MFKILLRDHGAVEVIDQIKSASEFLGSAF
jgi:hypothetical protein